MIVVSILDLIECVPVHTTTSAYPGAPVKAVVSYGDHKLVFQQRVPRGLDYMLVGTIYEHDDPAIQDHGIQVLTNMVCRFRIEENKPSMACGR